MHFHIRNDDNFDDDDDAMGHGVCQIMMFVDGGGWGSGKTQNKMTSFMNSALLLKSTHPTEQPTPKLKAQGDTYLRGQQIEQFAIF